jgi:hypothetical protein
MGLKLGKCFELELEIEGKFFERIDGVMREVL